VTLWLPCFSSLSSSSSVRPLSKISSSSPSLSSPPSLYLLFRHHSPAHSLPKIASPSLSIHFSAHDHRQPVPSDSISDTHMHSPPRPPPPLGLPIKAHPLTQSMHSLDSPASRRRGKPPPFATCTTPFATRVPPPAPHHLPPEYLHRSKCDSSKRHRVPRAPDSVAPPPHLRPHLPSRLLAPGRCKPLPAASARSCPTLVVR
jgi:hypothetical protein